MPAITTTEATPLTLSVLVCNYNHGRLISRAIEAILTQSRPADEFIIVDDGSTDDSVSVIRSWAERYPSIRLLQNERNIGIHASFQRGITAATGDFLYGGAADDRVLPGFFEGAMQMAEKYPTTGVISGQYICVSPSGHQLSGVQKLSGLREAEFLDPARYLHEILEIEPATHSLSGATIFRRQPLLDVGGIRAELGSWGDTFALQVICLRHGFCYWPHPAMEFTLMPGSLSQTTKSDPIRAMQIVDRAAELMRSEPYRNLFPEKYVNDWIRGFRQSIAHEQLNSVIEGNQAVQEGCKSVAKTASFPAKVAIEILRFAMRGLYFVTFRILRFVVARRLEKAATAKRE